MRHWLTNLSCLLTVVLGIWAGLSLARPTPHYRIHPLTRIISNPQEQQQQSGPQALLLSPAYRRTPPSVLPKTIGKRDGIFIQELSSSFILHYHVFSSFTPSWSMALWLAEFWFKLGQQLVDTPDHFFLEKALNFESGPLRLQLFNAGGGSGGIPRAIVIALANAMVGYTERGFCGTFNARISHRENGGGDSVIKLWITFRIIGEGLGEVIGA